MGDDADNKLSRRAFLRGAGTVAVGLPFAGLIGGLVARPTAAGAAEAQAAPKRLVTFFFPNGCPPDLWLPETVGPGFELRGALTPLERHRERLALISGLHDPAAKEGSGDDHSRGAGAFGVGRPNPFSEADIIDAAGKRYAHTAGGPSIDQVALAQLDPHTLLGSLEVGVMREAVHTRTYHVQSWRGVNQPNPPIVDPLNTFHRIFGAARPLGDDPTERERRYARSVLDTVVGEYQRVLSPRYGLSQTSRGMVADHLDAVRDLERRALDLDRELQASCQAPAPPASFADTRDSQYAEVFRLQAELVAMALRCDVTRFASVMCGAAAEAFKLGALDKPHHSLGHDWQLHPDNGFVEYTRFQMRQLAYLLDVLDDPAWPDPDGRTVLENTVLLAGTEVANPSRHDHDEMLYLVAGGAGAIRTGTHHRVGDGTNRAVNDLYTACLGAIGVETAVFGEPRFCTEPLNLG